MLNHSCVCPDSLDRCDRCDLLLDFPGLHLVAVTKGRRSGLVLEVESCDPVTGCPGCGVVATGHGRVMVELIDAPWAGRAVRIRWRKRRWVCREDLCEVVSFVEQDPAVCAPRGLLSTRAIRWAIDQLRREGATIQGLARQLGTTWNTLWSQVRPLHGIIELGRRIARGFRNVEHYRLRMLLITGGLDASPHTQL